MSHRYAIALALWFVVAGIAQADFRLRYVATQSLSAAQITASEVAIPSNYREQAIDPSLFAPD